jgi:hypothetical protein
MSPSGAVRYAIRSLTASSRVVRRGRTRGVLMGDPPCIVIRARTISAPDSSARACQASRAPGSKKSSEPMIVT